MRWIINCCAIVIGAAAAAFLLVYLFIEIQKEQIKKDKIARMQQGIEQMVLLQKEGLALHDERIKAIHDGIIQAHNDLKEVESRCNVMTFVLVDKHTRKELLGQFVNATKDMINQYKRDTIVKRDQLKC